jgi:nickel-dependent lactate racemase
MAIPSMEDDGSEKNKKTCKKKKKTRKKKKKKKKKKTIQSALYRCIVVEEILMLKGLDSKGVRLKFMKALFTLLRESRLPENLPANVHQHAYDFYIVLIPSGKLSTFPLINRNFMQRATALKFFD